jgi:HSP20 family protein
MTDKTRKETSRRDDESDSTALAIPGFGLTRMFEDFMRPFDEFVRPLFPSSMGSLWTELGERQPTIDLQDRGDHYVLTAELPGFEKKDVEVRISENVLELKGERKTDKESKSGEGTQRQSSRSYFQRYMTLPEEVVSEKVSGTMKNGVLELKLPKREPKALDRSKKVDLK